MSGPRDYARIYRENAIRTASPGQLILMMFDGAARAMATAHAAFERPKTDLRRIEIINRELIKAQAIFSELRGSLRRDVGGEFAETMDRLYRYFNRRLIEANLRKQLEPLAEVEKLFSAVHDAWAEMLRTQNVQPEAKALMSA
jgi:flagellar protein FliS